jgi:cytochrome c oxidase assembly factor CtaG/putative copper export protein
MVAVSLSALAVALVVAGGAYEPPPPGITDAGATVVWGTAILRLLTNLAAIGTVGWLLAAAFLDPAGKGGIVSREGRADLKRAAIAAGVWALLAWAQMIFTLADVLGVPLATALDPAVFTTYINEIPITRALLAMTVLAFVVCVSAIATATTGSAAAWVLISVVAASLPALAGHGAGMGDHALALTAGVCHVAAAVIWIGGLFALAMHAARRDMPLRGAAQRFSAIALIGFILLGVSGVANGYTRLETPDQLLTTGYGQLLLTKSILLVGLGAFAWILRTRVINTLGTSSRASVFARIAGLELTVMAIAVALGVALSMSAPPRINVEFASFGESLLGFAYPPAPTASGLILGFRLDPLFFVGSLVAAGLYCAGYARLRARGDSWPIGRLISWLLGIGVVIWCTNAGISSYSQVSVGLHMLQHMTITMLAPILLVLGAPATLALRALKPSTGNERGPREWLTWLLHSWITRILTNPVYVFIVYVLGLYGLYLTPAFGWLMGSHVGHIMMQVHFLVSGYLFYWVVIGIDPRPRPLPYWGRMLLLLLALAVHGIFAVILMMGSVPLAPEWYGIVRPPWVSDPLQDSLYGGQVAWGLSEIPTLLVMIVIAVQWSRSDDREAVRRDRQADRDGDAELNAYNDRLARLARRDDSGER